MNQSELLFERAQVHIPGGVNSPVRAFRAVGGKPLFIKKAHGAFLYDEDDKAYIELINSWGPMILGHASPIILEAVQNALSDSLSFGAPTRKEVEIAELLCELVPSLEMVRLVNSGTEATMSAIRAARGYTKRDKIIKFEGCYHGHGDSFLIAAGSGAMTMGNPDSAGITQGTANDTLTAPFNNLEAVEKLALANKGQIAAIILEPVVGNMGVVLPADEFLVGLRALCDEDGIVLIFDEVMTGFRLSLGGYQAICGITPDMTTLGKIIGGGLPVGAYGGKKEIMESISPVGKVYQAGTLSGNPIAVTAGLAMLRYLKAHPEVYTKIENTTHQITEGMQAIHAKLGLPAYTINRVGSMYTLFFTTEEVHNFEQAKTANLQLFAQYFQGMLQQGVYLAPSQYESLFVSTALDASHIAHILEAHETVMRQINA